MQLKIVFHIATAVVSSFYIAGPRAQPPEQARISDVSIGFATAIVKDKPGLLSIHGTPGEWAAFETYLARPSRKSKKNLEGQAQNKRVAGNIELQACSVGSVMAQYPNKKWLFIGHSLGNNLTW